MPSNKPRLYVVLYARGGAVKMSGGEDKYHWALLVGPKIEVSRSKGNRYHAKGVTRDGGSQEVVWGFEGRETFMDSTAMILVRILVAKVEDKKRLESILEELPMRESVPGWNCVEWVKEALEALRKDGKVLGTSSVLDWQKIRDKAMWYVEKKAAAQRFDGQSSHEQFDMKKVAMYDLLEEKETMS